MKPVDCRNETWESLQTRLDHSRATVWRALLAHGPATTRELAQASGIDILTVRPRVTELVDLFLAELVGGQRDGREGVYRALTSAEGSVRFAAAHRIALGLGEQALLRL